MSFSLLSVLHNEVSESCARRMVNIIISSFRMYNIDMKKSLLTLRLSAPSDALLCATYEQLSKTERTNSFCTG